MSLIHCINKKVHDKYSSEWKGKLYRQFDNIELDRVLSSHGEGLFIHCFESKQDNIVSKAISLLSGKYSHVFISLYSNDIRAWFTEQEWERLKHKYEFYYNYVDKICDEIVQQSKLIVLGSADATGMNYFDAGTYQDRKQVIIRPPVDKITQQKIVRQLMTEESMNRVYDYTGLTFWWLFRMFDDERAWYCSEQVYDVYKDNGYNLFEKDNPSPTQLVKYAEKNNLIIWRN